MYPGKNTTLSEQACTLQDRLSDMESELKETYGWLRPSEHPADVHHKFDPNTNPYKLLELQEQKLAESRDFIEDLSVEIGDLKKDRVRLREQVDRLDSMYKRFEKEATDKGHQLQRYQDFFQKLFEPKEAAAFAEMRTASL
ncbi:unnamed protein product [Dibothriocephalus latus]|uniref:Uncharacterized protein n=1 Tax=Dibothriocephalus latus TaxID=60516 RepID=A0A3P7PFU1_DIBLA|nr:unnamed protein product [Dibothriocephalus latus]